MGFFDIFDDVLNTLNDISGSGRSREQREYERKLNEAGSLGNVFENAEKYDVDIFDHKESNGYIKNNNDFISKQLNLVNANFDARVFMTWAKNLFSAVASVRSRAELPSDMRAFVSKDFDFEGCNIRVDSFSACYMHLYRREGENELLQVYISVLDKPGISDREAKRYFMRFFRPSQFRIEDMRKVKISACPNCGAPVKFKRGDTEQCAYCGHYVTFEEYGWQLTEIEPITEDTVIENIGEI